MDTSMISHNDLIGQPLSEGDIVAYRVYNFMDIGQVTQITPKRVWVRWIKSQKGGRGHGLKSQDVVKLDSAAATMYVLRHSS